MLLEMIEGLSRTLVLQELDPTMTNRHLCQRTNLPTNGANCKDSICNDPIFVLGSNTKVPNNKFVESGLKG